MQVKPKITFQDILPSQAIENDILKRIDKLHHYYQRLTSCAVVVKQIQKHKHRGKLYCPSISLCVPGEQINVSRAANEDVFVAIRDAFNAAQRQLKNYARKNRGAVKHHDALITGNIARVFEEEGFGFIEANGVEYYFSTLNVHNTDFEKLRQGMKVNFLEMFDTNTPQANRINIIKANNHESEES